MKKYIYIIGIVLIIIGAIWSYSQSVQLKNAKLENTRLTKNQTALNAELKFWKLSDSSNVAEIQGLTYDKKELKAFNSDLVKKVSDLNLKLKNVQAIVETQTQTINTLRLSLRDSVNPITKDTMQCFTFKDKWTDLSGCVNKDTVDISLKTYDKLTTIINKVPKCHFLWWSWGVKGINVDIISENPNTTFDYAKYIELK